jgi:hypothetical protein
MNTYLGTYLACLCGSNRLFGGILISFSTVLLANYNVMQLYVKTFKSYYSLISTTWRVNLSCQQLSARILAMRTASYPLRSALWT